jgi:hypothetical protein
MLVPVLEGGGVVDRGYTKQSKHTSQHNTDTNTDTNTATKKRGRLPAHLEREG